MSGPRPFVRRCLGAGLTAVLMTGAFTGVATAATGEGPPPSSTASAPGDTAKRTSGNDKLGAHDRNLLADARSKDESRVTVIVATTEDGAGAAAGGIERLGGDVAKRRDKIGYLRASVPTGAVEQVAALDEVTAVDLNETVPVPEPLPKEGSHVIPQRAPLAAPAGPGADTPDANPYLPTRETGAVKFKKNHPSWDGRGVTIGILDTGVSLDHPALDRTSTGKRKIVGWFTATDPVTDGDPTWLAMCASDTDDRCGAKVSGPEFEFADKQWSSDPGSYFMKLFREHPLAGAIGRDINRDGDTDDKFGVLYDPGNHKVLVDLNQNHSFTDSTAMLPYREKHQVGHFGTDDPNTAISEEIPFVVNYRTGVDIDPGAPSTNVDFVNIGIVSGPHGTHVAGITAGHQLFGGDMDGAAPGARIVSGRACTFSGGCTAVALTEGMIHLVTDFGVDVVNMSIGGLGALNEGANAQATLYNRLIDRYGVQMFISAGNAGPGINTVGSPSTATDVMSVGASVTDETWKANYGADAPEGRAMFPFSSRGPREDGGMKPDITAPGAAISSIPPWLPGNPVPEAGYDLPPGYAMFNGTSMASPQAAGAAALLLSASFAKDMPVTPAQLRTAIRSGAKFNPNVPAYAQGSGQFNVPAAWDLLATGEVAARDYEVVAPVCTPLSDSLTERRGHISVPTPDSGPGVYNRCTADNGGQQAGKNHVYKLQITRMNGPDHAVRHTLTWQGNDGTFATRKAVKLPLGKTKTIVVRARPETTGAHGALLRIDDPSTPGIDHRVLNTVVAANEVSAPNYQWSTSDEVKRTRARSYFVTVPEGAKAMQVVLSGIATGSQVAFRAYNPYGLPVGSTCYTNEKNEDCDPVSRHYADPMPGVWEITVQADRTSPFPENPFELSVAAQGVTVEPATTTLDSVQAGEAKPLEWTATNEFGPVSVTPRGGPLGSAHIARPSVEDGAQREFTVDVPQGASRLDVGIGNPSDPSSDLDLYVYSGGELVVRQADGDSEEAVSIENPAAGTYTVLVNAYSVPSGQMRFDYRDVFYSSDLGSLEVSTGTVGLAHGDSVTVEGAITAKNAPIQGRRLFGELRLVTAEGAVAGTGTVLVKGVTE